MGHHTKIQSNWSKNGRAIIVFNLLVLNKLAVNSQLWRNFVSFFNDQFKTILKNVKTLHYNFETQAPNSLCHVLNLYLTCRPWLLWIISGGFQESNDNYVIRVLIKTILRQMIKLVKIQGTLEVSVHTHMWVTVYFVRKKVRAIIKDFWQILIRKQIFVIS